MYGAFRGGMGVPRQSFDNHFHCYSFAMFAGRGVSENGDKILLPTSALDTLTRMHIDYPMLFELTNETTERKTHCGVLEFTAEEGKCYIPYWMMQNLAIAEGTIVRIRNVSLEKVKYLKMRPQSVDFLDIPNHRVVLERSLRTFTCATTGDMWTINFAGKQYQVEVTEVKPNGAGSVIETDCEVDFEAPVGYVEPRAQPLPPPAPRVLQRAVVDESADAAANGKKAESKFAAFGGSVQRVDGRAPKSMAAAGGAGAGGSTGGAGAGGSSSGPPSASTTPRAPLSSSSSSSSSSTSSGPAGGAVGGVGGVVAPRKAVVGVSQFGTTKAFSAFSGTGRK